MQYDVIVIGGGNAGLEASTASARLGKKTALITFDRENIESNISDIDLGMKFTLRK